MKTIVFFSTPAKGHVNAVYPVIKRLCRKYKVIVYSSNEFKDFFISLGAKFVEYPINFDNFNLKHITSDFYTLAQNLVSLNESIYTLLLKQIHQLNPTLIIYDSMCSFGKLISFKLNIKSMCFVTTLAFNPWVYFLKGMFFNDILMLIQNVKGLLHLIKKEKIFRKNNNLPKFSIIDLFVNECDKTIVFTPPEFQPLRRSFKNNFYFVGTTIKDRLKESHKHIDTTKFDTVDIYISLGTIFTENTFILSKFINDYQNSNSNIVISAGKLFKNFENHDNIITKENVNQLEVLKKSRIFINHAGLNSVYESIYLGVYQICIPQQKEQLLVAKIVEKKRLGKYIKFLRQNTNFNKLTCNKNENNIAKYKNIFQKYDATEITLNIIKDYIG